VGESSKKDEEYMNLLQENIRLKKSYDNLTEQHETAKELIAELEGKYLRCSK